MCSKGNSKDLSVQVTPEKPLTHGWRQQETFPICEKDKESRLALITTSNITFRWETPKLEVRDSSMSQKENNKISAFKTITPE